MPLTFTEVSSDINCLDWIIIFVLSLPFLSFVLVFFFMTVMIFVDFHDNDECDRMWCLSYDEITSGGLPKMAMGRFLLTLPPSGSTAGEVAFFVVEKTKWF